MKLTKCGTFRRPNGLRANTLPAHPQRQPDELLSSWIVHLARANRCKVHTLGSRLGGNQHVTWNRDIDRLAPEWLIEGLTEATAIPADEIKKYTLANLANLIDCDHHPRGSSTWILPLGIWHRTRRRAGVQYCPLCFRFDKRPYIRASWRLAYYTECEHHHCLLRDDCPQCGASLDYFRGELGSRAKVLARPMSTCTSCGFDLGYAPVDRFEWPDWQLTVGIRTLQLMNDFGWAFVGDKSFDPAFDVLLVLRQLVRVMSSRSRVGQLYDAVASRLWPEGYQVLSSRGTQYEKRCLAERHRLFGMAVWLLMDWPVRLDQLVSDAGIPRYSLTRDMLRIPAWFGERYMSQRT